MASSAHSLRRLGAGAWRVLWTVLLVVLILGLLRLKPLAAVAPALRFGLFVLGPIGLVALALGIALSLKRRAARSRSTDR